MTRMRDLIRYYTREAGVRNLERELANLARKAVKEIVSGKAQRIDVTAENLGGYAGVRKFRYGEIEGTDQVGVVTGLAWTEVGGETLTIEAVMVPGKGRFQTTGKLGDVMKESIDAARSYARSRAITFGIKPPLFDRKDIHVHVPEGATPKDGPSAGVAMATSIISVLTGIPVRRDVAMTGEITLRGRVLPIGGLEGEAAGGAENGTEDRHYPVGERKGSRRDTGQREEWTGNCSGRHRGRSAENRVGPAADPDRVGRTRRGAHTPSYGGRRRRRGRNALNICVIPGEPRSGEAREAIRRASRARRTSWRPPSSGR